MQLKHSIDLALFNDVENFRYSPIYAFGKTAPGEDVPSIWQGGTIGGIISKPVRTVQHPAMHLLIANAGSGSECKNPVFNLRRQTFFPTKQAFNSFHYTS